jgi:hypothetical protein
MRRTILKKKTKKNNQIKLDSIFSKIFSTEIIFDRAKNLIASDRYDQLYYLLNCLKLFPEIIKRYQLTPEDLNEFKQQSIPKELSSKHNAEINSKKKVLN